MQRWYFDYKSNFTMFYIHVICILIMILTKKSGFQRIPPVRCTLQISRCTVNKEITSFFSSFTWLGDKRAILIPLFPSWCPISLRQVSNFVVKLFEVDEGWGVGIVLRNSHRSAGDRTDSASKKSESSYRERQGHRDGRFSSVYDIWQTAFAV